MFDINAIPKREEFKFWFIRRGTSGTFDVISNESGSKVGWLKDHDYAQFEFDVDGDRKDVIDDFKLFCTERPEYYVGAKFAEKAIREAGDVIFDKILAGTMLIESGDAAIPKIESCLNWLHGTDFYTAPASTQYHDAEPGGLHMHSLRVVNKINDLYQLPDFAEHVELHRAVVVALVHDWCKINFYEPYKRNVKNEETGVWEQVQAYRYGKSKIPMGHGETSLYIAQKFFKLTMDQALAIRWHMGDPGNSESYNFWDANEKYPLVNMLQFADRLSIVNY